MISKNPLQRIWMVKNISLTKFMEKQITINPKIMCGKPVIKGTRIPVYLILNLLAAGYTFERIIEAYPQLDKKNIKAALNYAQFLCWFFIFQLKRKFGLLF